MKQAIIVAAFAWASICCAATGWAQAQPAVAYYSGDNNVPAAPGAEQVEIEEFVAGVQGNVITVAVRQDKCSRSFYLKGTFVFRTTETATGTISGTMSRCTTPALLPAPCSHLKNYQVPFTGTITRSRGERAGLVRLVINVKYGSEKYVLQDCKKLRTDIGTDTILLTEQRPNVRTPTGQVVLDDIDEAEKLIIDGLMKGLRQPK